MLQLIAAFVTFLILAISSRPDKGYQFTQIAITLIVVGGTIIGIVIMVAASVIIRLLV